MKPQIKKAVVIALAALSVYAFDRFLRTDAVRSSEQESYANLLYESSPGESPGGLAAQPPASSAVLVDRASEIANNTHSPVIETGATVVSTFESTIDNLQANSASPAVSTIARLPQIIEMPPARSETAANESSSYQLRNPFYSGRDVPKSTTNQFRRQLASSNDTRALPQVIYENRDPQPVAPIIADETPDLQTKSLASNWTPPETKAPTELPASPEIIAPEPTASDTDSIAVAQQTPSGFGKPEVDSEDQMTDRSSSFQPTFESALESAEGPGELLAAGETTAMAPAGQIDPSRSGSGFLETNQSESGQFVARPPASASASTNAAPNATSGDLVAVTQTNVSSPPSFVKPPVNPTFVSSTGTNEQPIVANEQTSPDSNTPVVDQRAMQHIVYGKSLARRGASFAARQEFIQALRLIAESYDALNQSKEHTRQLAAALRALTESNDFLVSEGERQLTLDLKSVVSAHSTKVISASDIDRMTAISAMQTYYSFAAQNLAAAAGDSKVAGEALYSLGKLLTTVAKYDSTGKPIDGTKAMVMFQASLIVDQNNSQSAHELGVLMASNGRWENAKELFLNSLRIQPKAETWKNLAITHQELNESQLAQQAINEYEKYRLQGATGEGGTLKWVSTQEFASAGAKTDAFDLPTPGSAQTANATDGNTEAKAQNSNRWLRPLKKWF